MKEEKNIEIKLLLFYFLLSIFTFVLYLIRHPIWDILFKKGINRDVIIYAYLPDLILFLIFLIPYNLTILIIIYLNKIKRIKINDNVFIILFFPQLSFFIKGMSLLQIYIKSTINEIFIDNIAFFLFLLVGPIIILLHKLIIITKKNKIFKNNY